MSVNVARSAEWSKQTQSAITSRIPTLPVQTAPGAHATEYGRGAVPTADARTVARTLAQPPARQRATIAYVCVPRTTNSASQWQLSRARAERESTRAAEARRNARITARPRTELHSEARRPRARASM
jgi:hypothetical protein